MATREEIEETYNFMDQVVRVSFGGFSDVSCAMYNGDYSKSLEQAQRDRHTHILDALGVGPGSRVLDIGCGWGRILRAVRARGGRAVGVTLSTKQVEACVGDGLDARLQDWREINPTHGSLRRTCMRRRVRALLLARGGPRG